MHLGVDICDLLDSTPLSRPAMLRSDDAPIRALSELLDELILGVDDERRVESLERVALHPRCLGAGTVR